MQHILKDGIQRSLCCNISIFFSLTSCNYNSNSITLGIKPKDSADKPFNDVAVANPD